MSQFLLQGAIAKLCIDRCSGDRGSIVRFITRLDVLANSDEDKSIRSDPWIGQHDIWPGSDSFTKEEKKEKKKETQIKYRGDRFVDHPV